MRLCLASVFAAATTLSVAWAWVLPLTTTTTPQQRRVVVVYGGRKATPLGRTNTPAGKRVRVAELASEMEAATLLFSFKGEGLDVPTIDALRAKLPETATAKMVKNKLFKLAGEAAGWSEETLEESQQSILKGSNLWVFSGEDMKGALEGYDEWIKDNGLKEKGYEIRGGFMEGAVIDDKAVKATTDLPTKPELMARLAGAINMAGPLGIATKLSKAKGNPQGLAVRLKQAAGGKLATALKISVADEDKNTNN